jgi:hypothetical protein
MERPGRQLGRVALMAFNVLAIAACSSDAIGAMQCKPCPGNYLDPNGLIGPDDHVASIRVCIDGVCRTARYDELSRSEGRYANIIGTNPPNRQRIERIEVTTFDARNKVVRVATGTSIDLPAIKKTDIHSCICTGLKFAYDSQGRRFVVTTQ